MPLNNKKIKFITVAAVVLIFVLVLVFITLLSQKIQLNIKERKLNEQLEKLQQLKEELGDEDPNGEYRMVQEQIEKYLREQKGLMDAGKTVWKPSD